jgi:DNA repair exonuclease SbcCD ATPase subunit
MLKINNLTVKNFMSVGNQTQAINFNREDLTLVLGENLDTGGGDTGSRNGTGKTTIINALSYGLFGSALTNIRKDNLINKTNGKHMLVTIDFECSGTSYRIERGRKPNLLKLYINDCEKQAEDDNSQGDSRETQAEIEHILQMSHDMFKHVIALNTYTEPFLSMRSNDQRNIIEQLLGITQLSEKAESLKEQTKLTRDQIQQEEYRIKSVIDANKRIEEQIESLQRRQTLWQKNHQTSIDELTKAIEALSHVDIDTELLLHAKLAEYNESVSKKTTARQWIDSIDQDVKKQNKLLETLKKEINDLESHTCYACGQQLHDDAHEKILKKKQDLLQETTLHILSAESQKDEHVTILNNAAEIDKPEVFYTDINDAYNHRTSVEQLASELEKAIQQTDPYTEQIEEMKTSAIEEVSYDELNKLTKIKDHQDFLYKLLTNKDSFIRKRIIDQNISFLNSRLDMYLGRLGLPHTVEFRNDLNVEITELGRDLDFDNLSRGERTRLILSLSWSFRDVWEHLYQSINLLFVDELMDNGLDANGTDNALSVLKQMSRERNKSVWLVSHKEDLAARVHNILKVIKENGFTSYNTDIEIL